MPTLSPSASIPRTDIRDSLMEATLDQEYIGLDLFPVFDAPDKTGRFGRVPVEALRKRVKNLKRKPKSGYTRSEWELADDSWNCEEYGHEEPADDGEASAYGDYFDYEVVLAGRGRNIVMLDQEIRIKDQCHDTVSFTGATNTLSVSTEWSTSASCTPINDVQFGIEAIELKCGSVLRNNLVLQISRRAWRDLSLAEQIREALKYTGQPGARIPLDALADLLGVGRIVVGTAMYNSADEGQAPSMVDVWDDEYAFLCLVQSGGDIAGPGIGRTFAWDEDGGELTVEEYREEQVRGSVYRVRQNVHNKRFDTAFGFLFSNVAA